MEEDFDEGSAAAAVAAAAAATTAGSRACSELLQQCEEYAPLLKEKELKDHEGRRTITLSTTKVRFQPA
jgi:hypothetical protein